MTAEFLQRMLPLPEPLDDGEYFDRKVGFLLLADVIDSLNTLAQDVATIRAQWCK